MSQDWQQLNTDVIALLKEARQNVLQKMRAPLTVAEKTSRKDLVTNVDKANEKFLIEGIRRLDPDAQVLGEEGFGDQLTSLAGRVWIVDPIDGTMNFVKQQDNFAIMIGIYQDGVGQLGYIFDVMANVLYFGGPQLGGVWANDREIQAPADIALADGLIGASGPLVIHDVAHMQKIVHDSAGMRISGSAGIEIINIMKGETLGYISHLKPWDIAAGQVLMNTLGVRVSTIDGKPLNMLSSNLVLVATKKAQRDILQIEEDDVSL
ncbi:inositol monophosphatase family protein [Levilactobacillus yiduensis]|uniref:inositol monophosphatase family protein n=1 Tax=Levilactobacillus yiduensis TaxID=2953880 RepID=UPI000EF2A509|nr:inositol monophosphatase family protein [Levilactobacillus yiduensis]AYM03023.1 inositol monophosphatase family protein [Levilactobacillus brevis]